jgi:hypothetical protein
MLSNKKSCCKTKTRLVPVECEVCNKNLLADTERPRTCEMREKRLNPIHNRESRFARDCGPRPKPGAVAGLTGIRAMGYHGRMFETFCFLAGLGFSFLVYVRSIRRTDYSRPKKAFYFLLTLIGITGTLFLFGVLVADKLRNMRAH